MPSSDDSPESGKKCESSNDKGTNPAETPAWTSGLKQLYDSVVDEPLPDQFKDLLAQLDETDSNPEAGSASDPTGKKPSDMGKKA